MRHLLLSLVLLACGIANAQEQFTVYFDVDKDEAAETSAGQLRQWMALHKGARVEKVWGYADSTGTRNHNRALSQRRADYVLRQLKQNNYAVAATQVKGFGETTAFSENLSSDRIVIIHYTEGQPATAPAKPTAAVATPAVTPPEAPPAETGLAIAVEAAKKGDRLVLRNMNFYNNLDVMLPEATPVLAELLAVMKANPALAIAIHGHICCNKLDSRKLSYRRAKVIYNYLLAGGIDKKRLAYHGFAGTRPIHFIPEKTEEEKAENRRVEIEIVSK